MKKYYELNPKSPYYKYMQNTDIENSLTEAEKDYIAYSVKCGWVFSEWESEPIPQDEKDFLMYSTLNKMSDYDVFCILVRQKFPKRIINKYKLLRKWDE